jgi:hypothetical protein
MHQQHSVGTTERRKRLTQTSRRQQPGIGNRGAIDKDHVNIPVQIAVLEAIVNNDHIAR